MTDVWTPEAEDRLRQYLATHHLPSGLGTEEEACSIAAVNLALTGTLTGEVPACMSEVVGRWVTRVQDAMPDGVRNSPAWKEALVGAAGTGRDRELERRAVVLDWLFGAVLPVVQPAADRGGYGEQWLVMCTERTYQACRTARAAADATAATAATATADAAYAAAAYAAADAAYATAAADATAATAYAAAYATAATAYATAATAYATATAAYATATADAAYATAWERFDPAAALSRMCNLDAR